MRLGNENSSPAVFPPFYRPLCWAHGLISPQCPNNPAVIQFPPSFSSPNSRLYPTLFATCDRSPSPSPPTPTRRVPASTPRPVPCSRTREPSVRPSSNQSPRCIYSYAISVCMISPLLSLSFSDSLWHPKSRFPLLIPSSSPSFLLSLHWSTRRAAEKNLRNLFFFSSTTARNQRQRHPRWERGSRNMEGEKMPDRVWNCEKAVKNVFYGGEARRETAGRGRAPPPLRVADDA